MVETCNGWNTRRTLRPDDTGEPRTRAARATAGDDPPNCRLAYPDATFTNVVANGPGR